MASHWYDHIAKLRGLALTGVALANRGWAHTRSIGLRFGEALRQVSLRKSRTVEYLACTLKRRMGILKKRTRMLGERLEGVLVLGQIIKDYGVVEDRVRVGVHTRIRVLLCHRGGERVLVLKQSSKARIGANVHYYVLSMEAAERLHELTVDLRSDDGPAPTQFPLAEDWDVATVGASNSTGTRG